MPIPTPKALPLPGIAIAPVVAAVGIGLTATVVALLSLPAQADVIVVEQTERPRRTSEVAAMLPALPPLRGMAQAAVLERLGEPQRRHAPVGGDGPRQPPITRWDYPGYSVFFENDRVIDTVTPGQPAPLHDLDALRAAP